MSSPSTLRTDERRLGDFELLAELGRGGMGVVYSARQVSLNRPVALKVLAGRGLGAHAVERFRREAEAAARLHHSNIVPVYAIGEQDGVHFYAMELIDGPSLDRVIERLRRPAADTPAPPGRLPAELTVTGPYAAPPSPSASDSGSLESGREYFDTVARLIAEVADALDHAHSQGVIHRDLKPSNLLLSSAGRLSVSDFGLARVLEQPGLTQTGDILGTPAYMSPEQIVGGRIPIDHRTDIYSLGATIYELLTLRPPFPGERRDQVLAQIIHKEPAAPHAVNRAVPRDLETICLKCLEKDPDRRYDTGKALADDLRRYLNRHAILARRTGVLEKARKWCRRHPGLAASLAALLLAVCGAGYFAYQAARSESGRRAEKERHEEQLRAERRQTALERALLAAMGADFAAAERAIDDAVSNGASIGEVRLLRGQVALHRGNSQEALEHLKEAARLLPDSVAAQAILVRAYFDSGRFDRYYVTIKGLLNLTPVTAEDHLFLGHARGASQGPKQALPLLDRAIEMRDSPIARLLRADALTRVVSDSGSLDDLERCLGEARLVKALLPRNPVVAAVSLNAHLAAACIYEGAGQPEKRREVLRQAGRDADELRGHPPFAGGVRARMLYLDYTDDRESIRAEYERARGSPASPLAGRTYFHSLFRQGRFAEALAVLQEAPTPGDETLDAVRRAFTLAHLPDGPARALALFRALRKARQGQPYDGRLDFYPTFILFLLGRKQEAADDLRPKGRKSPWLRDRFLAGQATAEEMAAIPATRYTRCDNHFFIAMACLADGDRKAARAHFEKSVASRVLWFLEYEWSRSFLAQLDRDPNWPPWIPPKR